MAAAALTAPGRGGEADGAPGAPRGSLPDRAALAALPCRVIHAGSATKSAVAVFGRPDAPPDALTNERFVVKDVRPMHPLVRALYGRRVLRREERALRALAGVTGVPRLLGRIDDDALALEYIAAEPLRRTLEPTRLRRACTELAERVAALHARGVVHLDLRQKRNILVAADGAVFLVDFQSAWVLRPTSRTLRWLARLDRSAVLKFRWRYVPDLLDATERRRAQRFERLRHLWFFHRFGPLLRLLFTRHPRRPRLP